jgi:ATP-binding cassette, subfamily C (CFTR/MRP), member 1
LLLISLNTSILVNSISDRSTSTIYIAIFNLVASIVVLLWSYLADERQLRPSSSLILYYITFMLLNMSYLWRLRTNSDPHSESVHYVLLICVQAVLCTLENSSKEDHFVHAYDFAPPESTKGIINRTFFWWLKDLFIKAASQKITSKDMFGLPTEMQSSTLSSRILNAWEKRCQYSHPLHLP